MVGVSQWAVAGGEDAEDNNVEIWSSFADAWAYAYPEGQAWNVFKRADIEAEFTAGARRICIAWIGAEPPGNDAQETMFAVFIERLD